MKIAFVHKFLYSVPRGIERTTFSLANALARQGHDVTLVTPSVKQKRNAVEPLPTVHVHFIPDLRYYGNYHSIPFYLLDFLLNRYDMIFISFAGYGEGVALRVANLLWKQQYCIHFHFPPEGLENRYHEFERFSIAKNAKKLLGASRYVSDGVEHFFGRRCTPIPNGVDIGYFCPPESKDLAKNKCGFAATDKIVLSVAALDERKGLQRVIPAMVEVAGKYPEAKLVVLGDGPFRKNLETMVREYGLEGKVLLPGTVPNVLAYYQAADVYILLADREANSISLYEAWACGLPVVTRKGDAYSEVMNDEVGRMIDDTTTSCVVETLLEFISNPSLCQQIAEIARQYVTENFTWDVAAERLLRAVLD